MPFELGIDYGLRKFNPDFSDKRSLILETKKYDYMKAISDISGFDIKNHEDIPVKLVECIRAWFSETVKLKNLNSSEKVYSDFITFNTSLFNQIVKKYIKDHNTTQAERFATKEIEEMTIPEFINEIEDWIRNK
jgi:polyhydroxyalkanoate synthesis regulator protein